MKPKILLHVCCAPCSTHSIETLMQEYDVTLFFSNSNIYPKDEYVHRLGEAKKIAKVYSLELVEDEYNNERWMEHIKGLENEPEKGARCPKCFEFNLRRTAEYAKSHGYMLFTTTLTISPHKDSKIIFAIGKRLAEERDIRFLEADFKKKDGFRHAKELTDKHCIYRQNYCGCKFSIRPGSA